MPVPLHWRIDPLLYDKDCTEKNVWVTANKLVEAGQFEKIFFVHDTLTLNLFPILVRRIDFIRKKASDRILSRFPFLVLSEDVKVSIKEKDLLISEVARDYFYKSINKSILEWRVSINHYLERGAMPYPLVRCAWELIGFPTFHPDKLFFESARGKRYSIPTRLTKPLAYLCGVTNGDGHLHPHWLRIVDETAEHIKFLSKLLKQIFDDPGEIFQTGNAWNVELRSSSAVKLFNFLTDQTIQGAKYDSLREPLLLKELGEPYRRLYWRGAMDADGSFKDHISFTSASKKYVDDFSKYLASLNIKSKILTINGVAYNLTIPAINRFQFINQIGVTNPKKKADMIQLYSKIRCQFKGLNHTRLIDGLYFNLLELPSVNVIGLCNYITNIRNTKLINEHSLELGIATNQYAAYEKGTRAIPIHTVQKIVGKPARELMKLLSTQFQLTYQISASQPTKLPIKVTSEIIKLMSVLEPTSNYVKILLDEKQLLQNAGETFGLVIKNKRLYSRLVVNFCNTFGIYEKPSIDNLEFEPVCVKQ